MIVLDSNKKGSRYEDQVDSLVRSIGKALPAGRQVSRVTHLRLLCPPRLLLLELLWAVRQFFRILVLRKMKKQKKVLLVGRTAQLFLSPLARTLGLEVFWLMVEPARLRSWRAWAYGRASRGVTVLCLSQALFRQEKERYKMKPKEARQLRAALPSPEAHQESVFHEMAYKQYAENYQRNFVLGIMADLVPASGVEHVFQVVKMVAEQLPNIQLIVIGDGPERKNLLWLAKSMHIGGHVKIVATARDAHAWMQGFTVFMYTHQDPAWHAPEILMAMRAGCPIIAHKTPYTQELLQNTKEAILLDIGNREMVAQAIVNMANKPEWLEQLAENVARRAQEVIAAEGYEKEVAEMLSL